MQTVRPSAKLNPALVIGAVLEIIDCERVIVSDAHSMLTPCSTHEDGLSGVVEASFAASSTRDTRPCNINSPLNQGLTPLAAASPPLVSILVPVYNSAAYLPELCRSIQSQTHGNFEVLVFDDGSTDQIGLAFEPFKNDSRFKLLGWPKNRGLNAAWRELLNRARGVYWVSPGADDVLFPEFLERRFALLETHANAVIAHGPAVYIDANGNKIPQPWPKLNLPASMSGSRSLEVLLQHNIINQPSALVRAAVTRQILSHFDSDWKYAPDWFLWVLHVATGSGLVWDDAPLHQYRIHAQALSWDPSKAATRSAEIRLAPFSALRRAAQFSPAAADCWARWGKTLYELWLVRALKLRLRGVLKSEWLDQSLPAGPNGRRFLYQEWCKHGFSIALALAKERRALKRQSFRVSGLAQIDDAVFR